MTVDGQLSNQRLQRWCFDVELLWLAAALGVPVAEVQVDTCLLPDQSLLPPQEVLAVEAPPRR